MTELDETTEQTALHPEELHPDGTVLVVLSQVQYKLLQCFLNRKMLKGLRGQCRVDGIDQDVAEELLEAIGTLEFDNLNRATFIGAPLLVPQAHRGPITSVSAQGEREERQEDHERELAKHAEQASAASAKEAKGKQKPPPDFMPVKASTKK